MFGSSSFGSISYGGLALTITEIYDETGKLINLTISTFSTDDLAFIESRLINLNYTITQTELNTLNERSKTFNLNLTPSETDAFNQIESGKLINIILNTDKTDIVTAYEQDKLIPLSSTITEADYYPVLAEIDKQINLILYLLIYHFQFD